MHQFEIQRSQPLVSLVGMIAPSPDWFYGVSAVELLHEGRWVSSLAVPINAWDSGGDGGTTYMAEDMDLVSKEPTTRAATAHFVQNRHHAPVGAFIFKRVPATR